MPDLAQRIFTYGWDHPRALPAIMGAATVASNAISTYRAVKRNRGPLMGAVASLAARPTKRRRTMGYKGGRRYKRQDWGKRTGWPRVRRYKRRSYRRRPIRRRRRVYRRRRTYRRYARRY